MAKFRDAVRAIRDHVCDTMPFPDGPSLHRGSISTRWMRHADAVWPVSIAACLHACWYALCLFGLMRVAVGNVRQCPGMVAANTHGAAAAARDQRPLPEALHPTMHTRCADPTRVPCIMVCGSCFCKFLSLLCLFPSLRFLFVSRWVCVFAIFGYVLRMDEHASVVMHTSAQN